MVTISGLQLTKTSDDGLLLKAARSDGSDYTDANGNVSQDAEGLNSNDWYIINVPLFDASAQPGGGKPGDTAKIRLFSKGAELEITSPINGQFTIGASGSVQRIDIAARGVADFVVSPGAGYAPLLVLLADISTNAPASWLWDFGDGSTSNERNPVHSYSNPATYTISLTAAGPDGASTMTRPDSVVVKACSNKVVWINGTAAYYDALQDACNSADSGEIIMARASLFNEDVTAAGPAAITIKGGFDCFYSANSGGYSLILGQLTVAGGGALVIENILIR